MQAELAAEGHTVHMLAINSIDALDDQDLLVAEASYPMFQDTLEQRAWDQHVGRKDDFFIYDAEGALVDALPYGGERNTKLRTDEGYKTVKDALLASVQR
jgi:hypothetical protein